jgi:hypothetical protein
VTYIHTNIVSRGSSVSIVSDYGLDGRGSIFSLASSSRPALGPTQPPVQSVPGALSPGVKRGPGVMLTTHPLLVPRLRKSMSYTSFHPKCLYGAQRDHFTITYEYKTENTLQNSKCECLSSWDISMVKILPMLNIFF